MATTTNGADRRLITMPYSPWSERARWALLHHGLPFREVTHTPLTGELKLRFSARKPLGGVTVPLLVDGDTVVMDSMRIAAYVDSIGQGTPLFPEPARGEIEAMNERFEVVSRAGRVVLLELTKNDDEAAIEFLPPALRGLPFAAASSRLGSAYIAKKHGAHVESPKDVIRAGFEDIRRRIGSKPFVLASGFSYADILAATILQYLKPVDDRYVPLGPKTRQGLTDPALVAEFADLVTWRDALYAAHRPLAAQ